MILSLNTTLVLPKFSTKKSSLLFARLVLNAGHLFQRDALVDVFWSNISPDKAKKCLRTDLWRMRNVLDDAGVDPDLFLIAEKNGIEFKSDSKYELDVDKFESILAGLLKLSPDELSLNDCSLLLDCVDMYRGDLLEGFIDDWCITRREVLRTQYLMALERLMRYYQYHGDIDLAISYGQQLLCHDPFLEHIHLELIRSHYLKGNRPAAIKQYVNCRDILREELGVSPMEETERVYQLVISNKKFIYPDSMDDNATMQQGNISAEQDIDEAIVKIKKAEHLLSSAKYKISQGNAKNNFEKT